MDLDYEQVKGPDELVRRSFAGQDWPWTDPAREQLLATRARMPDGVLFIDRLLRLAGVEEAEVLYPPEAPADLERLLQDLEASQAFDKLKRHSVVYYLLKDYADGRAQDFASEALIPSAFAKGIDGLWSLDHCNFKSAIRWLSDPSVTPDFLPAILGSLCTVPPSSPPTLRAGLLLSFTAFVSPPLTTPSLALPVARAYSLLNQIHHAWDLQRSFSTGGDREHVLVGLLECCFGGCGLVNASDDPDAQQSDGDSEDLYVARASASAVIRPHRDSISILARMPFDETEDSLVRSFCLAPPPSIASSGKLRLLVRSFYLSRLINESRYVEAVRFERDLRTSAAGTGSDPALAKLVKGVLEIMPSVQREVVELEEAELYASAPSLSTFEPASQPGNIPSTNGLGGSWSLIAGASPRSTPGRPSTPRGVLPATAYLRPSPGSNTSTPGAATGLTPGKSLLKALAVQKAQRAAMKDLTSTPTEATPGTPATPAKAGSAAPTAEASPVPTPKKEHSPFVGPARLPSSAQKAVPAPASPSVGVPVGLDGSPGPEGSGVDEQAARFVHAAATPSAAGMLRKQQRVQQGRIVRSASGRHFGSPFDSPGPAHVNGNGTGSSRTLPTNKGRALDASGGAARRVVPMSQSRKFASTDPLAPAPLDATTEEEEEEDDSDDPLMLKPSFHFKTSEGAIHAPGRRSRGGKRTAARHPRPPFTEDGTTVKVKKRRNVLPGGLAPDDADDADDGGEDERTVIAEPEMREVSHRSVLVNPTLGAASTEEEDDEIGQTLPTPSTSRVQRRARHARSESVASSATSGAAAEAHTPRRSSRLASVGPVSSSKNTTEGEDGSPRKAAGTTKGRGSRKR